MRTCLWFHAALWSIVLQFGCATGPTIHIDKEPGVDMLGYKSFGFFDQLGIKGVQDSEAVKNSLKRSIRKQLERIGYVYQEHGPDLLVNFHLSVQQKQEVYSPSSMGLGAGFYGYRGDQYGVWDGYPSNAETITFEVGTLNIDLVDASRKGLVWQGRAEGRVDESSIVEPGPAIDRVVGDIFSNFPNAPSE